MYIALISSTQELPDLERLHELQPHVPIVFFNLGLDLLRTSLCIAAAATRILCCPHVIHTDAPPRPSSLDLLAGGDLGLPLFPGRELHHRFLCRIKPVYYLKSRYVRYRRRVCLSLSDTHPSDTSLTLLTIRVLIPTGHSPHPCGGRPSPSTTLAYCSAPIQGTSGRFWSLETGRRSRRLLPNSDPPIRPFVTR